MDVILLTLFACGFVSLVCLILGLIQRIFQRRNNHYRQLKNREK